MRSLALRSLLVLALVAPTLALAPTAADATGRTAGPDGAARPATAAAASGTGEWVPVDPALSRAGTGTNLAAGQDREATLSVGRTIPVDAAALVVQVQTTNATAPGTLSLGRPGGMVDAAVAYDAGAGSSTTVLALDADRRAALRATTSVRVSLTVTGYVTAAGAAPAAGATTAVPHRLVVDSATGAGGDLPPTGGTATVPLAGLAGVPTSGASAVWLSVQTHGTGTGSLRFGAEAGTVAETAPVGSRWTTTLVLAPLTPSLDLMYTSTGAPVDGLRVAVVGWVADGTHGTADGGALAAIPAGAVRVPGSLLGLHRVDLADGAVPANASQAVVRATVTTGTLPGELRASTSLVALLLVPDTASPLPARATSTVTTVVPVSRSGEAFVSVPPGGRLASLTVLGYRSDAVSTSTDRVAPTVAITSPAAGAQIDQATEPVVTLVGTAADAGSGVRTVTVSANGTDLGAAVLRTTATGEVTWALETAAPAGDQLLEVTATDWAGRTTTRSTSFTVVGALDEATVVSPDAHVLDETSGITEVAPGSVTLGASSDLRAGAVLVTGESELTPEGLLRRVTSVERIGGTTVLHTEAAALTDVFLQLEIRATDVPLGGGTQAVDPVSGEVIAARAARTSVGYTHSISDSWKNDLAQLTIEATLGVTLRLELSIETDWSYLVPDPDLEHFLVELKVAIDGDVSASAQESLSDEHEFPARDLALGRVVFMAGPVPVLLTPSLGPSLSFDMEFSGRAGVDYKTSITFTGGLEYADGDWSPISDVESSSEPSISAQVSASVATGVRMPLGIKVYELAGPYVSGDLGPKLSLTADLVEQQTVAKLTLDLGLEVGAAVEVLDKKLADKAFDLGTISSTLWTRTWKWSGSGAFGLVDVALPVCLPITHETPYSHATTSLGSDDAGHARFRVDPAAVTLLDGQVRDQHVRIRIPGTAPGDKVYVTWDHDTDGVWSHLYTEQARVYSDQEPDVWSIYLDYLLVDAVRNGYTGFTVRTDRGSVSAWTELTTVEYINQDQGPCAYRPDQKVADGLPEQDGLHWDAWLYNQVQFSLEDRLLPAGTERVQMICDEGTDPDWRRVDVAMRRASDYERWTERFETGRKDAAVWLADGYFSGAQLAECQAEAYDADGELLETFPLIGGTFDAPWRDVIPT